MFKLPNSRVFLIGALAVAAGFAGGRATGQTTVPATRPSVKELVAKLPTEKVTIDFSDTPLAEIVAFVGKACRVRVVDPFRLDARITMKLKEPMAPVETIALLDQTLLPLGYTVLEEATDTDPPQLELRLTTTSVQRNLNVYMGMEPEKIPATEELRTQVLTLTSLDPEKAKEIVGPVLDRKAEVVVNAGMKSLIITDKSSHIRTAATLLQALEKQAAENSTKP